MEKFKDFFIKDRPRLDRIVMRIFKDSNALTLAVEAMEVNFVPFLAEPAQIDRLSDTKGVTVTAKGGEGIGPLIWIAFNLKQKPFDDVRVRQAISLHDRSRIHHQASAARPFGDRDGTDHAGIAVLQLPTSSATSSTRQRPKSCSTLPA